MSQPSKRAHPEVTRVECDVLRRGTRYSIERRKAIRVIRDELAAAYGRERPYTLTVTLAIDVEVTILILNFESSGGDRFLINGVVANGNTLATVAVILYGVSGGTLTVTGQLA